VVFLLLVGGFMDKELRVFLESNAISIRKFLQDNYDFCEKPKTEEKKKRWRLKHQEIKFLPNLVSVALGFCKRYPDLVYQGKLVIVKDEFGLYACYVNPRIIKDIPQEEDLIEHLKEMGLDDSIPEDTVFIEKKLKQITEMKKIVSCFHGDTEVAYVNNLNNILRRRENDD
jgi:hypothetical protein